MKIRKTQVKYSYLLYLTNPRSLFVVMNKNEIAISTIHTINETKIASYYT